MAAVGEFIIYQRRRNLSANTIEARRSRITAFELWLGKRGGLLEATPDQINEWLDGLPITPETRYLYLCHLNSFYRWAVRADLLGFNPVDKIDRPKRAQRLPRPIDDDELALALEYAEPRMFAWLRLASLQGFRCIEISRLRVEDIDRNSMSLRVLGKGDKEDVMPLHPMTLAALVRFGIPAAGFVFTKHESVDPFSPATVSRYIAGYLHSLGSEATGHRARHHFGTKIHALTGDLLLTRDLLRHASSQTSELYAKVTGDRGRDVLSRLSV